MSVDKPSKLSTVDDFLLIVATFRNNNTAFSFSNTHHVDLHIFSWYKKRFGYGVRGLKDLNRVDVHDLLVWDYQYIIGGFGLAGADVDQCATNAVGAYSPTPSVHS